MREKRRFAERTKFLKSDEVRKKYFLVYEGKETEAIYFETIESFREKIGISPLIEVVPIIRSYSEDGWSNPHKILKRMIQNIEEMQTGEISYETLLNWIMAYFQENGVLERNRPLAKSYWNSMVKICKDRMKVELSTIVENLPDACESIVGILQKEQKAENVIFDIPTIINDSSLTYSQDIDKICLIVDRDKDSFTEKQYKEVYKQCISKKFGFYVTNPCFEFWLLMHFDDVDELNVEMLNENPKITSKRRYCEHELRKRVPGFIKSKYDATLFVDNINKAIENEKLFCEDIGDLENSIGSNIGILISEMKK